MGETKPEPVSVPPSTEKEAGSEAKSRNPVLGPEVWARLYDQTLENQTIMRTDWKAVANYSEKNLATAKKFCEENLKGAWCITRVSRGSIHGADHLQIFVCLRADAEKLQAQQELPLCTGNISSSGLCYLINEPVYWSFVKEKENGEILAHHIP